MASLSFTVQDNVAPIKTTSLANDAYSNDSTPTITVDLTNASAVKGEWVNLFDGATFLGAVRLTQSMINAGSATIKTTALPDGANTFSVTLSAHPQTATGSASYSPILTSTTLRDNIDTATPVISNIEVAGNNELTKAEDLAGFTVTGRVNGDYGALIGQTVTVSIHNGSTQIDSLTATLVDDGSGNLVFQVAFKPGEALPKGVYQVTASVTDTAGNAGHQNQTFASTACFVAGTMIRTATGEAAIETLKIGDLIATADGQIKPVRWIGRNTVSLVFADPLRTLPILIKAGALSENVPSRDLRLSPDHAVLVEGLLVQAGALVNGASIIRDTTAPQTFVYYHVELTDHALILAENTPAETFIDNVDRMSFDNWDEHQALYAAPSPMTEMAYPRAKAHRQVPTALRRLLAERAEAISDIAAAA